MSQVCKIKLELPSKLQGLVRLEPGNLTFSGSRQMLQFRVENWEMVRTKAGVEVSGGVTTSLYSSLL